MAGLGGQLDSRAEQARCRASSFKFVFEGEGQVREVVLGTRRAPREPQVSDRGGGERAGSAWRAVSTARGEQAQKSCSREDTAGDGAMHGERRRGGLCRSSDPDILEAPLPPLQHGSELWWVKCSQPH